MKNKLLPIFTAVILFLIPNINFGQTAPTLGTTSSFALFTAGGAFSVTGASSVTGNVGTHVGAFTGFPPGSLVGQIHVADPTSAQASVDVAVAYSALTQGGTVIGVGLGNGQILLPGVYQTGAASTLNGNLTLDGGGNPDALFIIRIGGALATGASSTVTLTNSASLCNVYWQIGGQFDLETGSVFRGTLVVDGPIHLLGNSSLLGRGLSTAGAISLSNNIVTTNSCACVAPAAPTLYTITQPTSIVETGSVILNGLPETGTWTVNPGGITGTGTSTTISGLAPGTYSYTVTNAEGCSSAASANVVINTQSSTLSAPTVTFIQTTCLVTTGTITVVSPTESGMTYSIDNSTYTNTTGIFTLVLPGTYTVTSKNSKGVISAGTTVTINAAMISIGCISTGTIVTINAVKSTLGCVSTGTSVTINTQPAIPEAPGAITGTSAVGKDQTGLIYSVPVITNATDYIWTLPTGATITSGANTNSITVGFSENSSSGDITVQGSNSCVIGPVSAPFIVSVFGLKVYPNPFTDHLFFELQLKEDANVRLEIFNIKGFKVATVFSSDVKAFNSYRIEYTPENNSSGVLMYRLIINEHLLLTGKLIHK